MNGLAASVLEDAGPLAFLGAQALYFAAPVAGLFASTDEIAGLARLLEDPESVQELARDLAEETETWISPA